jgi:hypothetical protein
MRWLAAVLALAIAPPPAVAAQAAPLHIAVIDGENAVNVLTPRTAVRPLVEVRDVNNQPVAGASVRFTIGGDAQSAAFEGGARTATAMTDALGRAASSNLNLLGPGSYQIQVQASYRGATATTTLGQTVVATAAGAAAIGTAAGAGVAGGAAGAGAAAAGAAAGGGGSGIAATTVGIISGAVGGGAFAAKQVLAKNDSGTSASTTLVEAYSGAPAGQLVYTNTGTNSQGQTTVCVSTRAVTGVVRFEFRNGVGGAGATASVQIIQTELSVTGSQCIPANGPIQFTLTGDVTGPASALAFTGAAQIGSGSDTSSNKVTINGSLSGTTITGTIAIEVSSSLSGFVGSGSTSAALTLQKQ